ncbi:MAG: hypothetical protein ABFC62_02030 [Clostridiaceae bacterium]|nr:hypothetical protein [Eubacteriales bacterium]
MRKRFLFVLAVTLAALLSACGSGLPGVSSLGAAPTPSASFLPQINPEGKETPPPGATPAPRIFSLEELLSAAELEAFVGQPVQATFDAEASEDGEMCGYYMYDIPIEGIDVTDSYVTCLSLTQNGMISPSELEKGHDAAWAYEDFRSTYSSIVSDFTMQGIKAFYVTNNSDVHVLFQGYYIAASFSIDDDFEVNLALNKSIVAFILDKISMGDVSLTS